MWKIGETLGGIFLQRKCYFLLAGKHNMGKSPWSSWSWLLGSVKVGLFWVCLYFWGISLLTGNSHLGSRSLRCLPVWFPCYCALNSIFCLLTTVSLSAVSVQLFSLPVLLCLRCLVSCPCLGGVSVNISKIACRSYGSSLRCFLFRLWLRKS